MRKEGFVFLAVALIVILRVGADSITGEVITGKATGGFNVSVQVTTLKNITIDSPQNTTYNFAYNSSRRYSLNLNVSSNFNVNTWWFNLIDLKHGVTINSSAIFTPNITFGAVRWSNRLEVYANDSVGGIGNSNVTFYINISNQPPVLGPLSQNLFVCEASSLPSQSINATDNDEDSLTFDIDPNGPFFIQLISNETTNGQTIANGQIYSGNMQKSDVGNYQLNISVSDNGQPSLVDSNRTNATVIEINNAPVITNIGVKTIWTVGGNMTFFHQTQVSDTEDGNQNSGNLTFNITFASGNSLFNISQSGVMNYTSNGSDIGVYNITICVIDLGIPVSRRHQNISLCGQTGSNQTDCENFSLTITNENRVPEIRSYYPSSLNFSASGTGSLSFNLSEYDPDGTIPDAYWYVDGVQKEYDEGSLNDNFTYAFGCGVSGEHFVNATITDGQLNTSVQWNITVSLVNCGGGGGISTTGQVCKEKWACYDWEVCQRADLIRGIFVMSEDEKAMLRASCLITNWSEESCGFQIRKCVDVNSCNTTISKPPALRACEFTFKPSCSDGITNCHDGSCEFLIDCGGPCAACPTCSDGIQNQGEQGVDCGGPCPNNCPLQSPSESKRYVYIWIIILILIVILIIRIYYVLYLGKRVVKLRKSLEKKKK